MMKIHDYGALGSTTKARNYLTRGDGVAFNKLQDAKRVRQALDKQYPPPVGRAVWGEYVIVRTISDANGPSRARYQPMYLLLRVVYPAR